MTTFPLRTELDWYFGFVADWADDLVVALGREEVSGHDVQSILKRCSAFEKRIFASCEGWDELPDDLRAHRKMKLRNGMELLERMVSQIWGQNRGDLL